MKRLLTTILVSATLSAVAQDIDDVIRYSNVVTLGSAKFNSMAGALGAVGGEVSSIGYNPASLGIFRSSQLSISPTWYDSPTKATYYDQTTKGTKSKFKLAEMGMVVVTPNEDGDGLKSFAFSFAYNRSANLSQNIMIKGDNPYESRLDSEVATFNQDQWAGNLFYKADLFVYDSVNKIYVNDYQKAGVRGTQQAENIQSDGHIAEYVLALGANFNDAFYFGGSMNILSVFYEQKRKYTETPFANISKNVDLHKLENIDFFRTSGAGLNMKIGMIYWLNERIRFGATLQTPTIFSFTDSYSSTVVSDVYYVDTTGREYIKNNRKYTSGTSEWGLKTPARFMGSIAFVFPKRGLIDVDCEFVNYKSSTIDYHSDEYNYTNDRIVETYRSALNVRVGGEFLVGPLALRAGYAYYGSPYNRDHINSTAHRMVYSGGLGLRWERAFFDIGYSYNTRKITYGLYNSADSEAEIKDNSGNLSVTIGLKI